MVEEASILGNCPLCNKSITFSVNKSIVLNGTKFPIPFKIEHCGRTLITYVDSNFKCLGTQLFFNIYQEHNMDENINLAQPFTSELISKISPDAKVIYEFNKKEASQIEKIPDLAEKLLLRIILKNEDVSLAGLIKESAILEKALNRTISKNMLLNILEKYIQKEVIFKHNLKIDEEEISSLLKLKIHQGGNV